MKKLMLTLFVVGMLAGCSKSAKIDGYVDGCTDANVAFASMLGMQIPQDVLPKLQADCRKVATQRYNSK